jgi:D-serine deaminase-like pyridoxal phosphate-dependent protein
VLYVAEEHVAIDSFPAAVGQKIRLVPSHGCTTCNLHRRMWIARNDVIEAVWPIEGSGCLE